MKRLLYTSIFGCVLILTFGAIVLRASLRGINTVQQPLVIGTSTNPQPTTTYVIDENKLWSLIQDWRTKNGLKAYIKDQRLCDIAEDRSTNDPILDNHAGLYKKYSKLPYVIQENLGTDINEYNELNGWLDSPPHSKVLHKEYLYSCVKCKNNYCSQIFSSFDNSSHE